MKTRANTVTNKKGNKSNCSSEFSNIFAERLKHAREKRGITQEQLAEKLGITPRTLQSYESACTVNVRVPNLEIVSQIATILECDITYLTGENDIDILRKTVGSASKITKLSMDNIERLEKLKPNDKYPPRPTRRRKRGNKILLKCNFGVKVDFILLSCYTIPRCRPA